MALVDTFVVDDGTVVSAPPPLTYSNQVLLDGALSYWRLGESAGTTAIDQKGIHNGTYVNAPTLGVPGLLTGDSDTAIQTSPTDRGVQVGDFSEYNTITTVTLEAWVKTSTPGASYRAVIAKQFCFAIFLVDGVFGVFDWVSSGFTSSGVNVADGNRHHLVAVLSATAGASRLYLDGAPVGPAFTYTVTPQGGILYIGVQPNQVLTGVVDEAAIYSTALSAAQVLAHYNTGAGFVPPPVTDYAGRWDASDVSSITASAGVLSSIRDKSPNGYTMAVYGGNNPDYGTRTINGITVPAYSGSKFLYNPTFPPNNAVQTFFAVVLSDSNPGADPIICGDQAGAFNVRLQGQKVELVRDYQALVLGHPTTVPLGQPFLVSAVVDNVTAQLRLNGVAATPVAYSGGFAGASTWTTIGRSGASGDNWHGLIAEVIRFNRALSPAEVTAMEAWLTAKWLGSPSTPQTVTPTGLGTAQSFGTLKLNLKKSTGGVSSAQSFGVPTVTGKGALQTVPVQGLNPYATVTSIVGQVISGDGHVVGSLYFSVGQFGSPAIKATITRAVGGVPSAQALGVPRGANVVKLVGVPSAALFGTIVPKLGPVTVTVTGVQSAQNFGHPKFYRLRINCKPDGALAIVCKPDGVLTLNPKPDGALIMVGIVDDG